MTADALHVPEKIECLQDFIAWNSRLNKSTDNKYYYRGHANKEWFLEPLVYRNDKFRKNESRLYNEMLCSDPSAFKEDNTVFERLTRMQHYGLPTRLLDLTTNPLVALYFACLEDKTSDGLVIQSDGLVMQLSIPVVNVFYPTTFPESCLVGIAQSLNLKSLKMSSI